MDADYVLENLTDGEAQYGSDQVDCDMLADKYVAWPMRHRLRTHRPLLAQHAEHEERFEEEVGDEEDQWNQLVEGVQRVGSVGGDQG